VSSCDVTQPPMVLKLVVLPPVLRYNKELMSEVLRNLTHHHIIHTHFFWVCWGAGVAVGGRPYTTPWQNLTQCCE